MAAMLGIRTLARAWVALSVAALGCIGCSVDGRPLAGPPADAAAAPKPAPAVSVTAVPVVQKSMPIAIDVVGAAEPFSTVAVHAQITGELTSVNFHDGDDVAKGQELFTLDRRPLEAALQQARANLDRDVAQLANARAQLKRYQDLSERGIATREQLDTSETLVTALEATTQAIAPRPTTPSCSSPTRPSARRSRGGPENCWSASATWFAPTTRHRSS
jgi:multidrug efflux system membrane fusion protein